MLLRRDGVGLDAHEDGEAIQQAVERLVVVLKAAGQNEPHDRVRAIREELGEQFALVGVRVNQCMSQRSGQGLNPPVGELAHVVGRDGEDVQEALLAPGWEMVAFEGLEGGRAVEPEDRVGDLELVFFQAGAGREIEGREIPVIVREGLGEGERGVLLRAGGILVCRG